MNFYYWLIKTGRMDKAVDNIFEKQGDSILFILNGVMQIPDFAGILANHGMHGYEIMQNLWDDYCREVPPAE